ncbi:leucine-rich repeat domain-containing protein [Persicimonas caeni]|uniref:Leucine-rich repeat domain-containing protein n=1 Tax=Persicimonas caeni TaxID=2292766 RepID=A0A4Y6Q024_PERCE|nr:leucine-rich repeat domain-containing protein [Persicimonas caeni]QDG53921.1 leucine-rich repeat domain-containing protein [Persicimonas caeni]QED35142.1 leucine-rich repeat domain-containing protein [Persicimonas caeni]
MKVFQSLDDALEHATDAHALRLNCKGLDRIPDDIARLEELRSLSLVGIHGDLEVSRALGELPHLAAISVEGPKDASVPLPSRLFETAVTDLKLKNVRVNHALPMAEQLTHLRLASHFIFDDIDLVCEHLTGLVYLEVWGHFARDIDGQRSHLVIPPAVEHLERLEEIEVVSAGLAELPVEFARLDNLQTVRLRNNAFDHFPLTLTELPKLESLEFAQMKQVTAYPAEMATMEKLRRLDLEGSWNHGDLPSSWAQAEYAELPEVIGELHNLEALDVGQCALPSLAPLSPLTELRELSVSWGAFEDLSPLESLQALEVLSLDDGWVEDISPLAKLERLRVLDILQTNVEDLTPLAGLDHLESLDIQGTPADDDPAASLEPLLRLPKLEKVHATDFSDEAWTALVDAQRG